MTARVAHRNQPIEDRALPELPKRKEAYTTYLYFGFAALVVVLTVLGFLWW